MIRFLDLIYVGNMLVYEIEGVVSLHGLNDGVLALLELLLVELQFYSYQFTAEL
jgi:hypothetical protein